MGILSSVATSRRSYLSKTELEQYANITITDEDEADDVISQAEEMIDAYCGFQEKAIKDVFEGKCVSAGGTNTFYLDSLQLNVWQKDYLKWCEVEIIGGTGAGQRRKITASEYVSGLCTVDSNWSVVPDTTSFYRIYQLGKFPRYCDTHYYDRDGVGQYYKSIPEAVKRATAAQVAFIKEMGDGFFNTDKTSKQSESIGDYSYTKGGNSRSNIYSLIAPKAKLHLRGITYRAGSL